MTLRHLLKAPLDLTAADALAFLDGVQGNILKGHGRRHSALVFLSFNREVDAARVWISRNMLSRLTSASKQREQTRAWKATRDGGETFFAFLLSYDGYVRLGVSEHATPTDIYFRAGMKSSPAGAPTTVTDPSPSKWDANFQKRIDAVALIADANEARLQEAVDALTAEIEPFCERVFVERGDQLTYDFGGGRTEVDIEHFGHQDGISQPLLIKQDIEEEIRQRGGRYWNPGAPLELGFVEERGNTDTFGSYLVFRKLEQNVQAFREARNGLAAALGVSPDDAAALAVGRYRDGRPVLPASVLETGADPNDFSFKSDPNAALCPYQAHIRKTNPRGDLAANIPGQTDENERALRIIRRGVTYGARPDLAPGSTLPPPASGVGLHFMCYAQRLLQFVIQQDGADSNDFVKTGVGPDATLGHSDSPAPQQWPLNGAPAAKQFLMANFVTMRGGEYFFAPSPTFLASL
jgi:deferrochelatase/peroxidase EfeB